MQKNKSYDVIVIGGGPAGMMAAAVASLHGAETLLVEKNRELGAKLLLTGKGRCNVTNDKSLKEFVAAFGKNGPFLYSTLSQFSNEDIVNFFSEHGLELKREQGGRYFPLEGEAHAVLGVLRSHLQNAHTTILSDSPVLKIEQSESMYKVYVKDKGTFHGTKLILATGGKSYPATGSTGDGYVFARSLGHSIIESEPALVPLVTKNDHIRSLQGLSLKNVELNIFSVSGEKETKECSLFGEMLFTHFGISGPIVLSLSHDVFTLFKHGKKVLASIDFKPALTPEMLDGRLQRELTEQSKKNMSSVLRSLLPQRLVPYFIQRINIDADTKSSQITRLQRQKICSELKDFRFEITSTLPVEAGIVTAGGVALGEINPKTLESKLSSGLYFAGELLDIAGPSGGYNLTVAFSTGYVSGLHSSQNSTE